MFKPLRRLVLPVMAVFLVACESTTLRQHPAAVAASVEIIKSPNDDRDYRYLELENGLRVVLISDMEADKSAASLTAFRGSFDDPASRPGLAHFLEHMLFIGTEKYPEPDGYFAFIKANGGTSNAYTATDHTNYFFDIRPEAFREGLDRFAQFFIAPLLQEEYVEREKNAVHSEYQLQLKDDGWRSFAVQKVTVNPDHPAARFNIGTLETLSGDVHAALLAFFEQNYSANQMGLVVLTNEPLDQLETWVSGMFAPVKNRNLPDMSRSEPLYLADQLPATLTHDNIKREYRVTYGFPMPAIDEYYASKPLGYIANLVGHEGEGSLHKLLNAKGWINGLSAGASAVDAGNSVMNIKIDLTEEGSHHIPEITGYVFSYLDMLQNSAPKQWIYKEQATVAELGFRFKEKKSAMSTVQRLGPGINEYPPEDLLVAPFLMERFDAALINRFLAELTRDNVLVTISRPAFEGNATEKWFGVSYDLQRGPVLMAAAVDEELALPPENPFLPDDLEVVRDDALPPAPAINDEKITIFLDTDTEFGVPRAVMHVSLQNSGGLINLRDSARANLYAMLVRDDLNVLAYPALLAGLDYQIATPPKGFRVSIGGYHDKQLVLLEEVLDRVRTLDIDPDRFRVLKGELLKDLRNIENDKPFLQGYQRLKDELLNASWTPDELVGAIETITLRDLQLWRDEILSGIAVQALVHGNIQGERVDELADLLRDHLDIEQVAVGEPAVLEVKGPRTVQLEIDHADASMVLYVQDDTDGFEAQARSALLTHLLAPGFFSQLRTEQQLGYVVTVVNTTLRRRGGISFVIQSPVQGPDELRRRTIEFVEGQVTELAEMDENEFLANKGGLIAKLTRKDKNLRERSTRYWSDLDQEIYTFDSNFRLAQEVAALEKQDMIDVLGGVIAKLHNNYMLVRSEGKFR